MTDGPNLFHFSILKHHGRVAITDSAALSGGIRSVLNGLPALPITSGVAAPLTMVRGW